MEAAGDWGISKYVKGLPLPSVCAAIGSNISVCCVRESALKQYVNSLQLRCNVEARNALVPISYLQKM
jgi:hypothetical protein